MALSLASVNGVVQGQFGRRFWAFSRRGPEPGDLGEIEAVAVDDALGYIYYADERFVNNKWHANPDYSGAGTPLALFATEGVSQ